MMREGAPAAPENILVVAGAQQGLDYLGKALLTAGDTVLCEHPTYLGALQAFSAYEPRYDWLRPRANADTPAAYIGRAAARAARSRRSISCPTSPTRRASASTPPTARPR